MNGTRKDVLDSWFSDMSEPFNMNSNHFSVVRVSYPLMFEAKIFKCNFLIFFFNFLNAFN